MVFFPINNLLQLCCTLLLDCLVVWQRRNRPREKQPSWEVGDIVKRASKLLHEFRNVHRQCPRNIVHKEEIRWKPLNIGIIRINFDSAVFEDLTMAGLGVIIQYSAGLIIVALS